jgi:hypothetical protein
MLRISALAFALAGCVAPPSGTHTAVVETPRIIGMMQPNPLVAACGGRFSVISREAIPTGFRWTLQC